MVGLYVNICMLGGGIWGRERRFKLRMMYCGDGEWYG